MLQEAQFLLCAFCMDTPAAQATDQTISGSPAAPVPDTMLGEMDTSRKGRAVFSPVVSENIQIPVQEDAKPPAVTTTTSEVQGAQISQSAKPTQEKKEPEKQPSEDQKVQIKKEVGYVTRTQDYLVFLDGLPSAKLYNIITTKTGARALVSGLNGPTVEALMLDKDRPKPGDYFELTGEGLRIPLHVSLFGRMINPLGVPLDNRASLPPGGELIDLDLTAPGIDGRRAITEQFYTGITTVDTLLPIGKGQRELIMTESRAGKRAFFLDVILSQAGKDKICIYAAAGRSEVETRRFFEDLSATVAKDYTIVVAATSEEAAPMIMIAPSIACALAEYYRNQGKDVLLIIDDLATHAKYSREISLLAGRVPGRESYPADIFYQHSSIVERAGCFNELYGGGSITLLPTIVTSVENFTSLIPTNVMSMTDGHILFTSNLRAQGIYPAIEVDRSVTRVGRQTQTFIHKVLSDKIRSLLADYHELERYGRFGSELSGETQKTITRGRAAEELIRQDTQSPVSPEVQILMLALVFTGFFDKKPLSEVRVRKFAIQKVLATSNPFDDLCTHVMKLKFDDVVKALSVYLEPLEAHWQTQSEK